MESFWPPERCRTDGCRTGWTGRRSKARRISHPPGRIFFLGLLLSVACFWSARAEETNDLKGEVQSLREEVKKASAGTPGYEKQKLRQKHSMPLGCCQFNQQRTAHPPIRSRRVEGRPERTNSAGCWYQGIQHGQWTSPTHPHRWRNCAFCEHHFQVAQFLDLQRDADCPLAGLGQIGQKSAVFVV